LPLFRCAAQPAHLQVLLAYGLLALPQLAVGGLQGAVVARQPVNLPLLLLDCVLKGSRTTDTRGAIQPILGAF
jgi:hypothetical protein